MLISACAEGTNRWQGGAGYCLPPPTPRLLDFLPARPLCKATRTVSNRRCKNTNGTMPCSRVHPNYSVSAYARVCRDGMLCGRDCEGDSTECCSSSCSVEIPGRVLQRSSLLLHQLSLSDSVLVPVTERAVKAWVRVSRQLSRDSSNLRLSLQNACSILEVSAIRCNVQCDVAASACLYFCPLPLCVACCPMNSSRCCFATCSACLSSYAAVRISMQPQQHKSCKTVRKTFSAKTAFKFVHQARAGSLNTTCMLHIFYEAWKQPPSLVSINYPLFFAGGHLCAR